MAQTKTICFANNKGGSGKSTTCANVGYSMVTEGKKVLLIDGDMQMNLTLSYFDEEAALGFNESGENLYTAIKHQKELTPYIRHTAYEGLDLIPSSILMSGIEVDLFTMWQREFVLRTGLAKIKEAGTYDYILIDCPPIDVVADASIITEVTDMSVFVMRANQMDKRVLPNIEELYKSGKYRHMALLLNSVELKHKKYGYGKSGYGYGYDGYGYKNYYNYLMMAPYANA